MRLLLLDTGSDGTEKLLEWFSVSKEVKIVTLVKTPDMFWEKFHSEKPDCVFIRAGDTGIDAIKTAETIRALNPSVMIVLLSGENRFAIQAYETGADGYLVCPVKEAKVKRCVEEIKKRSLHAAPK